VSLRHLIPTWFSRMWFFYVNMCISNGSQSDSLNSILNTRRLYISANILDEKLKTAFNINNKVILLNASTVSFSKSTRILRESAYTSISSHFSDIIRVTCSLDGTVFIAMHYTLWNHYLCNDGINFKNRFELVWFLNFISVYFFYPIIADIHWMPNIENSKTADFSYKRRACLQFVR